MDQLNLFDAAAPAACVECLALTRHDTGNCCCICHESDPVPFDPSIRPGHTYRILKNGSFIVTAHVDGVGRITATDRHLWPAVQAVEAKITAALAARPQEMF